MGASEPEAKDHGLAILHFPPATFSNIAEDFIGVSNVMLGRPHAGRTLWIRGGLVHTIFLRFPADSAVITLAAAISVAIAVTFPDRPASAQTKIEPKLDISRKLNLASRQAMLSQLMAKASCFTTLGADATTQLNELRFAHHLFDETLLETRSGSILQNTRPVVDEDIVPLLDDIDVLWEKYGPAVLARDEATVASLDSALLGKLIEIVARFEKKYGEIAPGSAEISAGLNVSRHQRVLTQKASKEFCFVAANIDPAGNRDRLKATMALLKTTWRSLSTGNPSLGLTPAPVGEIDDQIARVNALWARLGPIFLGAADGAAPSPEETAEAARQTAEVMHFTNLVVQLYEAIGE